MLLGGALGRSDQINRPVTRFAATTAWDLQGRHFKRICISNSEVPNWG
jgi:hypothetical protein